MKLASGTPLLTIARRLLVLATLALALAPSAALGASATTGGIPEDCDGRWFGVRDKGELAAFVAQLRAALAASDPVQFAVLARYPLQVNGPGVSSMSVVTPQTLQLRFSEFAPQAWREKLLATSAEDISCSYRGVGFAHGALWAQPVELDGVHSYRITVLNLPDTPGSVLPKGRRTIEFVCETPRHRVIVDSLDHDAYRYRAWNKPRPITDTPDLELAGDDSTPGSEGTGPCRYSIWRFRSGETEFSVSDIGCTEGDPPDGAVGTLTVQKKDKVLSRKWCQ